MTPELTLFCAVWNTAHLFRRSVETYLAQDLDPNRWELIVIDDNSPDHASIVDALHMLDGKVDYRLIRLEHNDGMRGNTVSFNTATAAARAPVLMETTPECLLPSDALRIMLAPHKDADDLFVAMKTYNLTMGGQLGIEGVDWRAGIRAWRDIPDWDSDWTQNNVKVVHFGTHQICTYRKNTFLRLNNGNKWPLFGDYGCLPAETRILTADLQWIKQGDVKVGDQLVGVDEFQPEGKRAHLQLATVLGVKEVRLPSYRMVFADGHEIIASAEHPWWTAGWKGTYGTTWVRTDRIPAGARIRKLVDPWDDVDPYQAGWLGGILDGEGSLENDSGIRLNITQNPGAVLDRAIEFCSRWGLDVKVYPRHVTPHQDDDWNSRDGHVWQIRTRNSQTALRMLGLTKPARLLHGWIGHGLPLGKGDAWSTVVAVEPVGERDLIGMHTSTRTFIAEGLVSHNTDDPWFAHQRPLFGIKDVTLPNEHMALHQWHAPFMFWMSYDGYAPHLNKHAHSTSNYMHDTSGFVPDGGTCVIWGQGPEGLSEQEKAGWRNLAGAVRATGGVPPEDL